MTIALTNGSVLTEDGFRKVDLLVRDGKVFVFGDSQGEPSADKVIDCNGKYISPGFADVHVHFREPGFSYKETIRTGSLAAAHGGYTVVCPMPNLKPAPHDLQTLYQQLTIIERDACIHVIPYGTITEKQDGRSALSDMEAMAPFVCAFSDDGKGVQTGELMEEAMLQAKALGKLIVAHAEDESLLGGTAIHDGKYAARLGMRGISSESEWRQVERDVDLAAKTGCSYHVCHVSTKESVEIIRQGKKSGVDVTCETGPHYLVLCEDDLIEEGRFKMNPPLRGADDRDALLEGLIDGTVDMIATDHAPHSAEEKARGLIRSAFGIVGLETSFPVLYTRLVREQKLLSTEQLIDRMALAPRRRFGLPGGLLADGEPADLTVIDPEARFTIDPAKFLSMGKATPFQGWHVHGSIDLTLCGGRVCWER